MKIIKHIVLTISFLLSPLTVATTSFSKSDVHGHSAHWCYEGENGPEHWGEGEPEFSKCKIGENQSPIDITQTVKVKMDSIRFTYNMTPFNIINNGHTIQVNYEKGSSIYVDGDEYNLIQFHFHAPSEHKVNGKAYDMVAHLVHKNKDGILAVVAVFMKEGKENDFIKTLWNNFPKEEGKIYSFKSIKINVNQLLPKDRGYYSYFGSLTTPPCSENVNWFILKTPVGVSKEQIAKFSSIFKSNARPVQPLHGRIVKESY